MTRASLYSRSLKPRSRSGEQAVNAPAPPPTTKEKFKAFVVRYEKLLLLSSGMLTTFLGIALYAWLTQQPAPITQDDIDAAVLHTLKKQPPAPSRAAVAYNAISPSIVLVKRLGREDEKKDAKAKKKKPDKNDQAKTAKDKKEKGSGKYELQGLGTGVVFSEEGLIFTCAHVIAGAEHIGVVFGDGTESAVEIVSVQPENDLAVLKAVTKPDDLVAATLRSTKGLKVGDEVVAVGFPFGIGPSATSGVVSGLRREHFSKEGQRNLIDLIQFDAAANPGNSGGPLVTNDGDVVGIVTSIMNPIDEGFFVGIGFAVPIENAASAAGVSPF